MSELCQYLCLYCGKDLKPIKGGYADNGFFCTKTHGYLYAVELVQEEAENPERHMSYEIAQSWKGDWKNVL